MTLDHVVRHLDELPEAEREPSLGRRVFRRRIEDLVKTLAEESILLAGAEAAESRRDPGYEAAVLQRRVTLLAETLMARLAASLRPDNAAVSQRAAQLGSAVRPDTRFSFEHVYIPADDLHEAARREARMVVESAAAGIDFAELVRRHSRSADVASGGRVVSAPAGSLDRSLREALQRLEVGEVSSVIETRTGFHVLRLIDRIDPAPLGEAEVRAMAERQLLQERLEEARSEMVLDLRQTVEVETDGPPWRVGDLTVDEVALAALTSAATGASENERRAAVLDTLLLAEEARRRGIAEGSFEDRMERFARQELVSRCRQRRMDACAAAVDRDRLRTLFESDPSRFASTGKARIDLIFVAEGADPYDTGRRLTELAARLRAGESFAELARARSEGPGRAAGGELGEMTAAQLAELHPLILKTASLLAEGDISDPVHCSRIPRALRQPVLVDGFAVVRLRQRIPSAPRSFAEAEEDVRAAFVAAHRDEFDEECRTGLLEQASFRIVRLPSRSEILARVHPAEAESSSTSDRS